jgi:hypothetical protein
VQRNTNADTANRRINIARIHQQDVAACRARHQLAGIELARIRASIEAGNRVLNGPTGDLPGVHDLVVQGIAENRKLRAKARAADCRSVPPLLLSP